MWENVQRAFFSLLSLLREEGIMSAIKKKITRMEKGPLENKKNINCDGTQCLQEAGSSVSADLHVF